MRYLLLISLIFISVIVNIYCAEDCDVHRNTCGAQTTCSDCMKAHHCCNWCYDQNGTYCSTDVSYCKNIITNSKTTVNIIKNDTISEKYSEDTIQVQPQYFNIKLRMGEAVNISYSFRPVQDYPLDLYYLVDASFTMRDHIKDVASLGTDLTELLKTLTANYKMALGAFMDKTMLPFSYTAPSKLENPCSGQISSCDRAFVYDHKLDFTENIQDFLDKVQQVKTSASMDNLDGGAIGLLQVLNCERYGWGNNSRRIILMASSSMIHWAGDGLLGGAIRPPKQEKCMSDIELSSSTYDYPALEDIAHLLTKKKTKIIIAAPNNESLEYFQKFSNSNKDFQSNIHVGYIETNNKKQILGLIKDGYRTFSENIRFTVNMPEISNYLDVEIFTDCGLIGKQGEEAMRPHKSGCKNVKFGSKLNFMVQFKLVREPPNSSYSIKIEEAGINEEILVNLEYIGARCDCHSTQQNCLGQAEQDCTQCVCKPGWSGPNCTLDCDKLTSSCRKNQSQLCFGKGDCECGKCICDLGYGGDYCEYQCATYKGKTCNDHKCFNDTCICDEGFTGEACGCSLSTSNCQLEDQICMGHGSCECNEKCNCEEGYSGVFCDIQGQQNILCDTLDSCVHMHEKADKHDNCDHKIQGYTKDLTFIGVCSTGYYKKEQYCRISYGYEKKDSGLTLVLGEENCQTTMASTTYIFLILATIAAGVIIALGIWKGVVTVKDKREYARFENEQKRANFGEMSPIYKDPISRHRNPMYENK